MKIFTLGVFIYLIFRVGPKNQSRGKKPLPSFALINLTVILIDEEVIYITQALEHIQPYKGQELKDEFHVADRCQEVHRKKSY